MDNVRDYASIYIENFDLSVTPVKGKVPLIKNWPEITDDGVLSSFYDITWEKATGLGLLCGEPSGIICLDIDILEGDENLAPLREELQAKLPPIMLGKIGNPKKPSAIFFKYNGEKNRKWKYIHVELLSTGNQVLMPPSDHPDGGTYKWYDKKLSEVNLDELPDLPDWLYDFLEGKNNEHKPSKTSDGSADSYNKSNLLPESGRCNHQSHNHISDFAMAKFYQGLTRGELILALIGYDKKINKDADYLYFKCPTRSWRSNDAKSNASFFVDQIFQSPRNSGQHGRDKKRLNNSEINDAPTESASGPITGKLRLDKTVDKPDFFYEDEKGNKKRSSLYEDYVELFEYLYPEHRKDYFSKICFYREKKEWIPIENKLRVIRAEARICGLVVTHVEDNIYKWFESLKDQLLVDIPVWDGEDHIGKLLSYIVVKNVTHNQFESLFKSWLANIFKRVYQSEFHNQCVILKGAQGIGKDMLLGNIFKCLNGYYSEIILSARQKDNYESIEGLMVSYIPEFDESNKSSTAALKAFISTNKATFRGAYDRKASSHTFRHSVVSSANIDNILRDPTGNRRFWIFEVESIDWAYNKICDSGQIMAQAFELYKAKFVANPSALESMREYIAEATPKATDELFIEDAHELIDNRIKSIKDAILNGLDGYKNHDGKIRWYMISDDIVKIARKYSLAPRTAMTILKNKGYSKRDMKNVYYEPPIGKILH